MKLVIDVGCGAQLHREFAILLNPPASMQGLTTQIQIDPPIFGAQTLPDLVSTPKKNQDSASLSKTKKSNRQTNIDSNSLNQVTNVNAQKLSTSTEDGSSSQKNPNIQNLKNKHNLLQLKMF